MRIAFVFPGQGSQSVGMLSGFADNAVVADYMARANAALGEDLVKLIAEGPAEVLSLTVDRCRRPPSGCDGRSFFRGIFCAHVSGNICL